MSQHDPRRISAYHRHVRPSRGAVALLTVILIGVMVVSAGVAAILAGQTNVITSGQSDHRNRALMFASACVEEALLRLKRNESYTGGTVPVGLNDTCTVTVSGSGTTRTITATAVSSIYTQTVVVSALRRQNGAGNAFAWSVDAWSIEDP